jgi:WD40 repeat protein
MSDKRIGQQLGNYRLTALLGEGGFAKVYLGEHIYISSQKAAIKVLEELKTQDLKNFNSDGSYVASASEDKTVQVWQGTDGRPLYTYREHSAVVKELAWSPDGKRIASTSSKSGGIKAWDIARGVRLPWDESTILRTFSTAVQSIPGSNLSPNGEYEASISGGAISVCNAATGKEQCIYRGHIYSNYATTISALAWSADSSRLASSSSSTKSDSIYAEYKTTIHVWDAKLGRRLVEYNEHFSHYTPVEVSTLAWSPNGKYIASSAGAQVQVWRATEGGWSGRLAMSYNGHSSRVEALVWSPDGKYLASGSADFTMQIWDAKKGETLFICNDHLDKMQSLVWSPDGSRIAVGSANGIVQVWDTTSWQRIATCYGYASGGRIVLVT